MAPGIAGLPEKQRARVQDLHRALYSPTGASYQEVFEALPTMLRDHGLVGVKLLGGHDAGDAGVGALAQSNPLLFDLVRGIVEQWPQPPDPIKGRSLADVLATTLRPVPVPPSDRQTLRALMRKVAGMHATGQVRRQQTDSMEATTPIPALGRRSMVLRAMGAEPLLHVGPTLWRHPVRSGEQVHVYLDVSGSMDAVKGTVNLFSLK